eukprot:m.33033 g.33033  ORF g.33033 m.33033 type:complete len:118 (+) comp12501_c0_seq2:1487-1840(+)
MHTVVKCGSETSELRLARVHGLLSALEIVSPSGICQVVCETPIQTSTRPRTYLVNGESAILTGRQLLRANSGAQLSRGVSVCTAHNRAGSTTVTRTGIWSDQRFVQRFVGEYGVDVA